MRSHECFEIHKDYVEYLERRVQFLKRRLRELRVKHVDHSHSEYTRDRIYEMAYSKKQYKGFVYARCPQIVQKWCLCMYCKLHRPDLKTTYIHWRSELETQLGYLNSLSLEKPKHRTIMTYEAMISDADMDEEDVVFKTCRVKFRHENENPQHPLNMSLDHQKEVCQMFSDNIENVVSCIGSNDIFTYTRSVFPDDY